jgi:hypothetical protein
VVPFPQRVSQRQPAAAAGDDQAAGHVLAGARR